MWLSLESKCLHFVTVNLYTRLNRVCAPSVSTFSLIEVGKDLYFKIHLCFWTMAFMDVCVFVFQFLCLCVYQYMFEIMCCVSSYLSLFVMRRFKRDGLHCCYILTVSSVFCFSFTLPLHGEKNNHIFTGPKLPRTMQASRGQSGTDTVFRESIWDSVQFTNSSI